MCSLSVYDFVVQERHQGDTSGLPSTCDAAISSDFTEEKTNVFRHDHLCGDKMHGCVGPIFEFKVNDSSAVTSAVRTRYQMLLMYANLALHVYKYTMQSSAQVYNQSRRKFYTIFARKGGFRNLATRHVVFGVESSTFEM